MIPFVTDFGDYHVIIEHEECKALEDNFLEAPLLKKGEIPTGKKLRIKLDSGGERRISLSTVPKNADWDELRVVRLALNSKCYKQLLITGIVSDQATYSDITIKENGAIGPGYALSL